MTIHEVYEKWKHLDHLLSIDPSFSSMTSWKDELNHDLWQAVKTEAEKETVAVQTNPLYDASDEQHLYQAWEERANHWQIEAERLTKLIVEYQSQLERIRTWTPVSARACPLCTYQQGILMALCEWHQEVEAVNAEATRPCLAEEEARDAKRWRIVAGSPQTAMMLGSTLDPTAESIDWLAECNRLADASACMATEERCIALPPPSYTDGQRDERERIIALLYAPESTYFVCDDKEHIYNEDEVRKLLSQEAP